MRRRRAIEREHRQVTGLDFHRRNILCLVCYNTEGGSTRGMVLASGVWWTWRAARGGSKPHYGHLANPISAITLQNENGQTQTTQRTNMRTKAVWALTVLGRRGHQSVPPRQHLRLWATVLRRGDHQLVPPRQRLRLWASRRRGGAHLPGPNFRHLRYLRPIVPLAHV